MFTKYTEVSFSGNQTNHTPSSKNRHSLSLEEKREEKSLLEARDKLNHCRLNNFSFSLDGPLLWSPCDQDQQKYDEKLAKVKHQTLSRSL